jgi:hypothetical protein
MRRTSRRGARLHAHGHRHSASGRVVARAVLDDVGAHRRHRNLLDRAVMEWALKDKPAAGLHGRAVALLHQHLEKLRLESRLRARQSHSDVCLGSLGLARSRRALARMRVAIITHVGTYGVLPRL